MLASTAATWASYYSAHPFVALAVRWLHLSGLVGGAASHRVVVTGLVVMALSGALMAAADIETFLGSKLYWTKMGLVALLALNGAGVYRSGRRALRDPSGGGWTWVRFTSTVSLVLWLLIVFVGLWLREAA